MDVPLRENPAIDDGTVNSLRFRLERLARPSHRTRGGHYHWVEYELAGHGLQGDFDYQRFLADVRNVVRLSPATTFAVRGVMGSGWDGPLPRQREFTLGGVDGLRAHPFAAYRGSQMALLQAEYTLGLYALRTGSFEGGLQALAFLDTGHAWTSADGTWDLGRQRLQTDAGFGLATSNDNLRLYFAKNLQEPESKLVMTLRLQQPF
jgi:hemolysin activation/secretion protein